jgi:hypothetical protein
MNLNQIPELENIINRLIGDLKNYSKLEKASQIYIDKQNLLIQDLISINNHYFGLEYLEVWQKLECQIFQLEEKDKYINAHQILLITGKSEFPASFTKIIISDI